MVFKIQHPAAGRWLKTGKVREIWNERPPPLADVRGRDQCPQPGTELRACPSLLRGGPQAATDLLTRRRRGGRAGRWACAGPEAARERAAAARAALVLCVVAAAGSVSRGCNSVSAAAAVPWPASIVTIVCHRLRGAYLWSRARGELWHGGEPAWPQPPLLHITQPAGAARPDQRFRGRQRSICVFSG